MVVFAGQARNAAEAEEARFRDLALRQSVDRFNRPEPAPPAPKPYVPLGGNPDYPWDPASDVPTGAGVVPGTAPAAPTPPPPPPPPPPGGGSGAGGGGASWQQLFDEQRAAAERARQNLDREYSSRRDELRSQYQFAETEQEKAQLAFLMAELESATERADQAILAGYANAVQNIQQIGTRAGAATDAEAQAVQNLFLTAGERFGGTIADVQQQTGLQAGLAGTAFMPGEDFANLLAADAAREAALSQRMGGIVSQEALDAERRMAFEQAAQQADLQRSSLASGAQTRADQQAAVAARIAADRRNFTDNLRQLQGTYATLGASFDQAGLESYGEQAGLAQSEALFLADLASRERIAAANNAARMAELEAQYAREDAQRGDWQTPELSQALLAWDTLPEILQTEERYRQIFQGLLPGVVPPEMVTPGEADARNYSRPDRESPASRPLVEIPDEEIEAEAARRRATQFDTEARAYYQQQVARIQQLVDNGTVTLPPGVTAADRALQQVQSRYPGWQP